MVDSFTRKLVHIQAVANTLSRDVEKLRSEVHHAKLSATRVPGPSPTPPPHFQTARPMATSVQPTNQQNGTTATATELQARQRRYQYILDRTRSLPKNQFLDLVQEELQRIWQEDPRSTKQPKLPRHMMANRMRNQAAQAVKGEWVKQGIWQPSFEGLVQKRYLNVGVWKHQEVMCLIDANGLDLEKYPNTYARMCRHRDASRPCNQFRHQVDKVRDRMLDQWRQSIYAKEKNSKESTIATRVSLPPANIDSQAYREVRQAWMKRRIWDRSWEALPGQHWRHERPLEEFLTPQEVQWYTEIKATWVEPGPSGAAPLGSPSRGREGVLETFDRLSGSTLGMFQDVQQRGLKRGRSLYSSSDADDSSEASISDEEEQEHGQEEVKEPAPKRQELQATVESASDGEPGANSSQSGLKRDRKPLKSPFVVEDDEVDTSSL
ncbi:hypothetical protein PG990_015277 [Apiospora arundinis]